jgi:16S rRNA (adenine1518-N6/adenine1519-N6)-dimethyltransferase
MNPPKISTPRTTQAILKKYNLRLKKKFGQNFLLEPNILQKIINVAQLNEKTNVIEIGPGIGALTEFLANNAHQVLAIEIDHQLIEILADTLHDFSNIKIIHADILKTNLNKIINENFIDQLPIKLVANLPYYITTPILLYLIESKINLAQITVMIQYEVAKRLQAQPQTKDYGSL